MSDENYEIEMIKREPDSFARIFDRDLARSTRVPLTSKYLVYDRGNTRISAGVSIQFNDYYIFFKGRDGTIVEVAFTRWHGYSPTDTFDDMARITKPYCKSDVELLGTEVLFCYFVAMNPEKAVVRGVPLKAGSFLATLTKIRDEKFRY